jgi:hypothetical protein
VPVRRLTADWLRGRTISDVSFSTYAHAIERGLVQFSYVWPFSAQCHSHGHSRAPDRLHRAPARRC